MTYDEIKKRIRSNTRIERDVSRSCCICGTHNRIESNHLYRVADLTKICVKNQFFELEDLYIPLADMCHTHHKKWHVLLGETAGNITIYDNEIDKYFDMVNQIQACDPSIPEVLQDDYIDLYIDIYNRLEEGIEQRQCNTLIREEEIKTIFDNDVDMLSYHDFRAMDLELE